MTHAPKAHDLIEHEVPSANVPDVAREHLPSMPLDPSMTAVAQGHVEGAWSITALGNDWMPKKALLLPEGRTKKVERGTAIRVQSADGWHHCEFPQSGMLYGPVVWAAAEAASEQALLSSLEERTSTAFVGIITWGLGTVGAFAGSAFVVIHSLEFLGVSAPIACVLLIGLLFISMGVGYGIAIGAGHLTDRLMDRWSPQTITSVNQRVSKDLRMPRSAFLALGIQQPHLKLVAPDPPQDDLDLEIRDHLERYHAQRGKLAAKRISSSPMMEHTFAMLEEISLRLREDNAAMRKDDLRRTYLELIRHAEANVSLALEKKDTEAADALIEDMTALLRQMDSHKR